MLDLIDLDQDAVVGRVEVEPQCLHVLGAESMIVSAESGEDRGKALEFAWLRSLHEEGIEVPTVGETLAADLWMRSNPR